MNGFLRELTSHGQTNINCKGVAIRSGAVYQEQFLAEYVGVLKIARYTCRLIFL